VARWYSRHRWLLPNRVTAAGRGVRHRHGIANALAAATVRAGFATTRDIPKSTRARCAHPASTVRVYYHR